MLGFTDNAGGRASVVGCATVSTAQCLFAYRRRCRVGPRGVWGCCGASMLLLLLQPGHRSIPKRPDHRQADIITPELGVLLGSTGVVRPGANLGVQAAEERGLEQESVTP